MIRALLTGLFISAMSGSIAFAADPALLEAAGKIVSICSDNMPNSKLTKSALKDAGFRYEGSDGSYHIYSLNSRRILAATSVTSSRQQQCMVSVSKMTPAEAEQLIQPWLKTAKATPVEPTNRDMSKAWHGTFKGGPVNLGILDHIDFGIMRGAVIGAVSTN